MNSTYPTEPLDLFSPSLAEMGQDLTLAAGQGKVIPVYGRDKEILQISEILRRREKRNPVLVGEAGVGKTAIVEAIALRIVKDTAATWLRNKKIISISLFDVIAQKNDYSFGEYAHRLKDVIKELKPQEFDQDGSGRIAFIDEIHTLIGYQHGANYLKQYLARGEIQVIGATTIDEYRQYIERDPALERRFAPVFIRELNLDETIQILVNLRPNFENEYKVRLSESSLRLAAELSQQYVHNRHQPDKAIELIDRACVRCLASTEVSDQSALSEEHQFPTVHDHYIRMVIAEWTNIPDSSLNSEKDKYFKLEDALKKHVIGQNSAISQVTRTVIAHKVGTAANPKQPSGVFLFAGPSGVGKSALARALALELSGKEEHLIVLDMTGYREGYTVASLVGVPPGNDVTQRVPVLTKLIRDHPSGVLLLDEIEKAAPEIWSLFMPVFEEGNLIDRQGTTVHFRNVTIVMTATVDPAQRTRERFQREASKISSQSEKERAQLRKEIYQDEVLRVIRQDFKFPKEFINRIGEIVVFYPLSKTHIKAILERQLIEMSQRLGPKLKLTKDALDFLVESAFKSGHSAREIHRIMDRHISTELALLKLEKEIGAWSTISAIHISVNVEQTGLFLQPSVEEIA